MSGAGSAETDDNANIREWIDHAAHLLPAQGPITAFVHHNTLHAFEYLPFEQGVVKGGETFGCHPYLPEERYREKLRLGRFEPGDIKAALKDDLGGRADEPIGHGVSRLELRLGMMAHPLCTGPVVELRWVVEEGGSLRGFPVWTQPEDRERVIDATRHWFMRDLRNGAGRRPENSRVVELIGGFLDEFEESDPDSWRDRDWEQFSLRLLWEVCREGVLSVSTSARAPSSPELPVRHATLLCEASGVDCDRWVNDVLIRFCAPFLDQDFAPVSLPGRERGFLEAFCAFHVNSSIFVPNWLTDASRELARVRDGKIPPLDSIRESLTELGVADAEAPEFITQTMLALRGYAGMLWQTESRTDRVAKPSPPGTLVEYLAVRLILERGALKRAAHSAIGYKGRLDGLREAARARLAPREPGVEQRAFTLFQIAQTLGWTPDSLHRQSAGQWVELLAEVEAFSGMERRRIYHLAFERRYRDQTLDALTIHSRRLANSTNVRAPARPPFQLVCCIDEREESFRRAVDEVAPGAETFGAAGFFAVAMNYRGAADAHFTPLCPVIIEPQHYVVESVVEHRADDAQVRKERRRTIGTVTHRVHMGSRTFAGGWLAAVTGSIASIPLVARILFPRLTARLRSGATRYFSSPAETRLKLTRESETPGREPDALGYSIPEMAGIVERLLRDIGATKGVSRLVVICGHGSSSLNNPHEAAHDCGACGGGRGGPNARAFAQMANHPEVRPIVAERGLAIPEDTVFVGAYHNTCDDSMTYYDQDAIPESHTAEFETVRGKLDEARSRSAHERCRRFESAPLQLDFDGALRHVEARVEDLSQVRPEYGHATNALCFIGRRAWSRGLYLDRRAFLQSYDPAQDDEDSSILTRILQAVIPVCAGINLEYYFSYVDPTGYGCGTKLPHNITSLLGVMNGAASDLRPGLPWQMVEIHEPVRLLFVIETTPEKIARILKSNPGLDTLVSGGWVQLAVFDSATSRIDLFHGGAFKEHHVTEDALPQVKSSADWYRGWRGHLGCASIEIDGTEKGK